MKYVLVTGGVISGVGKGIIASSLGTILKSCGIQVTCIKIDPYINLDAGTFSPYEHGEVFVLDDGSEVDLDLGNYERFLDVTLHKDNNITTGKIYDYVIKKERKGDYLGKTVQIVPHLTDAIQDWVKKVANIPVNDDGVMPEVCIIELGGTIGDIEGMAFVEAFRQFQFKVNREDFCCIHVSLVPQPRATGEQKTKPTQASVRELRGLGLSPDLIVCRSENLIDESIREKISNFCHVAPDRVICIHDLISIYKVPLVMEQQGVLGVLKDRLKLDGLIRNEKCCMKKWKELVNKVETITTEVRISLVGKYTKLEDSYLSISRALQHSALYSGYKLVLVYIESEDLEDGTRISNPISHNNAWQKLYESSGVIVAGGFGERGLEGKILASKWCREHNKPFLGICLGMQVAVIEFARNVLELHNSNTIEVDPDTPNPVIIDMPEHNLGIMGGTMRLGKKRTVFKKEYENLSLVRKLYERNEIEERHRHRFEVNPEFVQQFEEAGFLFVATDEQRVRMEIVELNSHPFYVGTQFHPEYLSRPLKPVPIFLGFILAASNRLDRNLSQNYSIFTNGDHLCLDTEESDNDVNQLKGPQK